MQKDAFEEAYGRLNTEQKKAVDTIEGPVMVIAGPGTGKTQILTLRIANILRKTDASPENILALTFTESGAQAMRERLRSYVGSRAYRVPILTFHAFAERLVREYPESYGRIIGGRAASDLEKMSLMIDILGGGTFKLIRPAGDPEYYVKPVLGAISDMKREYVTPEGFSEIIARQESELLAMPKIHEKGAHKGKVRGDYLKKEKSIAKNKELLLAYKLYESLLREQKRYDFDDMIVETVRALESHEDLLRELQETYQYVLADEHQDVNGSQNRILELLASYHDRPNLFVVGDEKQAIYRFQGASLENFLYFEEKFPHTVTIALVDNYRSGQTILDASHSLITKDAGPAAELRVPLFAQKKEIASIEEREFSHQSIEDAWLLGSIEADLASGVAPKEIAILFRTNREVEAFMPLLKKRGIAARSSIETDILAHPVMYMIRTLMRGVSDLTSEAALFELLHAPYWGIAAEDLFKVFGNRSHKDPLMRIVSDDELLASLSLKDTESVMRIGTVLQSVREREGVLPPHRLLEVLLKESGCLAYILKEDPIEGGLVVRRLYDEVERMVARKDAATLKDAALMIERRVAYNLPLETSFLTGSEDAVSVMTAHKSKGLEFEHVYIPHLTDNVWSGKRRAALFDIPLLKHLPNTEFSPFDDERRLLYVALTRAKMKAFVSYAEALRDERHADPSRLLGDLDAEFLTPVETNDAEAAFSPVALFEGNEEEFVFNAEILKSLFLTHGLSATALNNYLDSPWKYLYRNLLRIPEIKSESAQLGTALHFVMERVSRHFRTEGEMPNETAISSWLKEKLDTLPLSDTEAVRLHERGFAALLAYVNYRKGSMSRFAREEFKVRTALEHTSSVLPSIPLTGSLDLLELDESGIALRVIDYKSGKPKSRGEVEGTSKNSSGDYKRQLVFYALLLSLEEDTRFKTKEGVISFLEPDGKGVIHEEVFSITEEEIASLKGEIIRVAEEIVTGACLRAPYNECEPQYARLAEDLTRKMRG